MRFSFQFYICSIYSWIESWTLWSRVVSVYHLISLPKVPRLWQSHSSEGDLAVLQIAVVLLLLFLNLRHANNEDRAGPRGVVYGGALEAAGLKRAAEAVSGGRVWEGGRTPLSLEGGGGSSGDLPWFFFIIYLWECILSHFEALFSIFLNLNFK